MSCRYMAMVYVEMTREIKEFLNIDFSPLILWLLISRRGKAQSKTTYKEC